MRVWIVTKGEDCEGGHVIGVFDSEEKAEKCALEVIEKDYRPEEWTKNGQGSWSSGCDNIDIEERKMNDYFV